MKDNIDEKFEKSLDKLSEEQFWYFISTWMDTDNILDIMQNWEDDVKKDTIIEINKIKKMDVIKW